MKSSKKEKDKDVSSVEKIIVEANVSKSAGTGEVVSVWQKLKDIVGEGEIDEIRLSEIIAEFTWDRIKDEGKHENRDMFFSDQDQDKPLVPNQKDEDTVEVNPSDLHEEEGLDEELVACEEGEEDAADMKQSVNEDDFPFDDESKSVKRDLTRYTKKGIDLDKLAEILAAGQQHTADIKEDADVVLVLGSTGVGKSLLIQMIAGHKVKLSFDESLRKKCYVIEGQGEPGFDVGLGLQSKSAHTRSFFRESTGTFYVDTAGFGDNRSAEYDIATSVSVKDIACRAKRLRIVVLINARTFFLDRAAELRKKLDLIAHFVGYNFLTYKCCFTFLFTHCSDAFDSVRNLSENEDDHERVLSRTREELSHILKTTMESSTDWTVSKLINFMKQSLEKSEPFCDVFDPSHSNVCAIADNAEPAKMRSLDNPAEQVTCSLTMSSKLAINEEIKQKMRFVSEQIESGEDLSGVSENASVICILCRLIEDSFTKEAANKILAKLGKEVNECKDRLFCLAQSDSLVRLNPQATKNDLERLVTLSNVIEQCHSKTSMESKAPVVATQHEIYAQIVVLVRQLSGTIAKEASLIFDCVALTSCVCSHEHPDLLSFINKFSRLRSWAGVFGVDIQQVYQECVDQVRGTLVMTVSKAFQLDSMEELVPIRALCTFRAVSALQEAKDKGLIKIVGFGTCRLENVEHSFDDALKKLQDTGIHLLQHVPPAIQHLLVLTGCSDTESASHALSELKKSLEANHLIDGMLRSKPRLHDLMDSSPTVDAMKFVAEDLLRRHDVLQKAINNMAVHIDVGQDIGKCFQHLEMINKCLPSPLRLCDGSEELSNQLSTHLGMVLKEARGFLSIIRGGNPDKLKQNLRVLSSSVWFDGHLRSASKQPFVRDSVDEIKECLSGYSQEVLSEMKQSLKAILHGANKDKTDDSTNLHRCLGVIRRIDAVEAFETQFSQHFVAQLLEELQSWRNTFIYRLKLASSILDLNLHKANTVLTVLEALKKIDETIDAFIHGVTLPLNKKLDEYCAEIQSTFKREGDYKQQVIFLQTAQKYSCLPQLSRLLPGFEDLRNETRQKIALDIETLSNRINVMEATDVDNIGTVIDALVQDTSAVNDLMGGEMAPLINTMVVAFNSKKADLVGLTRFNEAMAQNDFPSINNELNRLKPLRKRNLYLSALKLLSATLRSWYSDVDSVVDMPTKRSLKGWNSMVKHYNLLMDVLNMLDNTHFMSLPPVPPQTMPWSLQAELSVLRERILHALRLCFDATNNAIRENDVVEAFILFQRSKCLRMLAERAKKELDEGFLSETFTRKKSFPYSRTRRDSRPIPSNNDLEKLKSKVEELLSNPSEVTLKFMEAISSSSKWCPTSFIETTAQLKRNIDKLKSSSGLAAIDRFYDGVLANLTEILESQFVAFQTEYQHGRFSRAGANLTHLRHQMSVEWLQQHGLEGLHPERHLKEFESCKEEYEETCKRSLENGSFPDHYGKELKKLAKGKGWIKDDYIYLRALLLNTLSCYEADTKRKIEESASRGVLKKLRVLLHSNRRLKGHLKGSQVCLGDSIFSALENSISRMKQELHLGCENKSVAAIRKAFVSFHDLVVEVSSEESQSKLEDTRTKRIHRRVLDFHREVHEVLLQNTRRWLAGFEELLRSMSYDDAAQCGAFLHDFGYFLGSDFEAYNASAWTDESRRGAFEDLCSLRNEWFTSAEFLSVGLKVATLGLSYKPQVSDVREAKQRAQSVWHPNKNPHDPYAHERSVRINQAADDLENEEILEFYRSFEFNFMTKCIKDHRSSLLQQVRGACADTNYHLIASVLSAIQGIEALNTIPKIRLDKKLLEEEIMKVVLRRRDSLALEIQKAIQAQDFATVHHAFESLDVLENCFPSFSGVSETPVSVKMLTAMRKTLNDTKAEAERILDGDESNVMSRMDEFGLQLIRVGRYYHEFPRLKKNAARTIRMLLNRISERAWGVAFIFKLGLRFQDGDISEDESDALISQVITKDFPHFEEVRVVAFNRRVVPMDVSKSVADTVSRKSTMEEETFDRNELRRCVERFQHLYEEFFTKYVVDGHKHLVDKVFEMVNALDKDGQFECRLDNWNDALKQNLVGITAGVFATFTILTSRDSYLKLGEECCGAGTVEPNSSMNPMNLVFHPHGVQVMAVFKLLGVGTTGPKLENHLMEVRTGEGKSLILGALSVVLSLMGFRVRCICYSEHLSERDRLLFQGVFDVFGVTDMVVYSTIKQMSEDFLVIQGDVREMTKDLFKGRLSGCHAIRKPVPGSDMIPRMHHLLPSNKNTILLVDEVDVFFGPEFYGRTFNPAVTIEDDCVEVLMRKIWSNRDLNPSLSSIQQWPEYQALLNKYRKWQSILEREVQEMCWDVNNFKNPPYVVDTINRRIGYKEMDSINWRKLFGYRTAFAHLHECESGAFKAVQLSPSFLKGKLSLRLWCGNFSYANISPEPARILGVSGTISDLNAAEWKIIEEFGVSSFTTLPSVYGPTNLLPGWKNEILIPSDKNDFFRCIANEINSTVNDNRAVLVVFIDDATLESFHRSSYFHGMKNVNLLQSSTSKGNRSYVIGKTATARQITLSTAEFGRGTDFFCLDERLRKNGGLHVVQAFLSKQKSEETQIRGRTARQGQPGSYRLILLRSDLEEQFSIHQLDLNKLSNHEVYNFLDERRSDVHSEDLSKLKDKVERANEKDKLSRKFLQALARGDERISAEILHEFHDNASSSTPSPARVTLAFAAPAGRENGVDVAAGEGGQEEVPQLPPSDPNQDIPSMKLGETLQFEEMGPVIINVDGSTRRIENWDEMTQMEREVAWRRISKRNAERRKKLLEQQQQQQQKEEE